MGNQTCALRHRQFRDILAEVVVGSRLNAVAGLAQINGVEIELQNLLFRVILLKFQGPEDLADLTVDGAAVVSGHVLEQLLGDGGAAEGVLHADEHIHRGADGTLQSTPLCSKNRSSSMATAAATVRPASGRSPPRCRFSVP